MVLCSERLGPLEDTLKTRYNDILSHVLNTTYSLAAQQSMNFSLEQLIKTPHLHPGAHY
jgi:hypothetical protein